MICPPAGLDRIATATTPDESTPDQGGSSQATGMVFTW
jgi:hypothetical protein